MSRASQGKELLAANKENIMATLVSGILRQQHPKSDFPMKRIARTTELNRNNIAKWYRGSNTPNLDNFLLLTKCYPNMLRMMLEYIDRSDVWELCVRYGIPQKMLSERPKTHLPQSINTDKYVSINVVVDAQVGRKLNGRQLWFLSGIQQGYNITAEDIVSLWRKPHRTARRDIAGLAVAKQIRLTGARRNGHYEVYDKKTGL